MSTHAWHAESFQAFFDEAQPDISPVMQPTGVSSGDRTLVCQRPTPGAAL
jgi:hypothetical protein